MIRALWRPRRTHKYYGWTIVWTLAVTETISWGILYYAFAVFLKPVSLVRSGIAACQSMENSASALRTPSGSVTIVPRRCSSSYKARRSAGCAWSRPVRAFAANATTSAASSCRQSVRAQPHQRSRSWSAAHERFGVGDLSLNCRRKLATSGEGVDQATGDAVESLALRRDLRLDALDPVVAQAIGIGALGPGVVEPRREERRIEERVAQHAPQVGFQIDGVFRGRAATGSRLQQRLEIAAAIEAMLDDNASS